MRLECTQSPRTGCCGQQAKRFSCKFLFSLTVLCCIGAGLLLHSVAAAQARMRLQVVACLLKVRSLS